MTLELRLREWLEQANGEVLEECRIRPNFLRVRVTNAYAADLLWATRSQIAPCGLELWVNYTLWDSKSHAPSLKSRSIDDGAFMTLNAVHNSGSQWAMNPKNLETLTELKANAFVYSSDRDSDHKVLLVKEHLHPKKTNKPTSELLEGFLYTWDDAIAIPRREAIAEALERETTVFRPYENIWQGWRWELANQVIPLNGFDEVLVVVHDLQDWQKDEKMWFSFVG